jgi:Transposase DDE domain
MEGRIFQQLYKLVREIGKTHSFKRKQFSDSTIVLVHLWAALWDRPISWACTPNNWPRPCPWDSLPTPSTMSRRLRTLGVLSLLEQVRVALRDRFPHSLCKWIDAKPLVVSGVSKDRDARWGRITGGYAKGYKIHGIIDASQAVDHWTLTPMNHRESIIAPQLISRLSGGGYLVGDNGYDVNTLYDRAHEHNYQLVAPRRPSAKSLGKIRHSPYRLRAVELLEPPCVSGGFGRAILAARNGIERCFAHWGNSGGGLSPLPNWVRRPRRVALWVQAKLLINGVRQLIKQGLTT